MSVQLTVEVATDPLEDSRSEVVVVTFFESDRPPRGAAGRADWRLCGQISRLLMSEKLTGAAGEAVLLATGRGWTAPRVLGLGLGPRREFDSGDWEVLAREITFRVLRLRLASMALWVSDPEFGHLGIRERVGALLRGAVAAVSEDSAGLRLQLVVAELDAVRAREAAAKFASRASRGPVACQVGVASEPGRLSPHGGEAGEQQGTQIFK